MSSLKRNFGYNLILTISGYIINLLLFPYVARVLGVEMIGKTGFASNVMLYFSMFAVLGITTVGVREISACGSDLEKRSRTFWSLFTFLMFTTFITLVVYLGCVFVVPRFQADKNLLLLGALNILFNSLLIEWLYQGMEEFRFIALRSLAIKLTYALAVVLLVKSPEDYILYFFLTVFVVVMNATVNLFSAKSRVVFRREYLKPFLFAAPVSFLGVYCIMTSMYTTFNIVFLGFCHNDVAVGYYFTATKIYAIIIGVLTAFTTVMLPRMSRIVSEGDKDEFDKKISASFDLVFTFAFPLIAGGLVLAPQLVQILSGPGYEGAITPMRIVMPVILIAGSAQVWVTQTLMPMKKDKILLLGAFVGAVTGIVSNIVLVPHFAAVGSAISVLLAEFAANSLTLCYSLRHKAITFPLKRFFSYLITSIPYFFICLACGHFIGSPVISLLSAVTICFIYFLAINRFAFPKSIIGNYISKWL